MSTRCFNFNDYAYRGKGSNIDELPAIPKKAKKISENLKETKNDTDVKNDVTKEELRSNFLKEKNELLETETDISSSKDDGKKHAKDDEKSRRFFDKNKTLCSSSLKNNSLASSNCIDASKKSFPLNKNAHESNHEESRFKVEQSKDKSSNVRLASIKDVSRKLFPSCKILFPDESSRKTPIPCDSNVNHSFNSKNQFLYNSVNSVNDKSVNKNEMRRRFGSNDSSSFLFLQNEKSNILKEKDHSEAKENIKNEKEKNEICRVKHTFSSNNISEDRRKEEGKIEEKETAEEDEEKAQEDEKEQSAPEKEISNKFVLSKKRRLKICKVIDSDEEEYSISKNVFFSKEKKDEEMKLKKKSNNTHQVSKINSVKPGINCSLNKYSSLQNQGNSSIQKSLSSFCSSSRITKAIDTSPCSNSSDSCESEEENSKDHDEKASKALYECLNIADSMGDILVRELGGKNIEHRNEIRKNLSNGRCFAAKSYNLPEILRPSSSSSALPSLSSSASRSTREVINRLKDYQKVGIQWLMTLHDNDRNGILADEMGLGKTAQTCVFLNYLYSSGKSAYPTIIAAPASLLDNWMEELKLWSPFLSGRIMKYHGKQNDRRCLAIEFLQKMCEEDGYLIMVTSTTTITSRWDEQYLKQIKPIEYLVVDEAHSLKNKEALTYKKLNKTIKCRRRLLLTGSPIQNRTEELRNLLLFVMPKVFDNESLNLALNSYANQAKKKVVEKSAGRKRDPEEASSSNESSGNSLTMSALGKQENESSGCGKCESDVMESLEKYAISRISENSSFLLALEVECLQHILSPFILRRLKSEVLSDLPKKINIVLRCDMEKRQKEMYIDEILLRKSELAKQLNKLTAVLTSINCNDPQQNNICPEIAGKKGVRKDSKDESEPTEDTETKKKGMTERKRKYFTEENEEKNKNIKIEKEESPRKVTNKKFVNSLLFRLRRICNHPLLMQRYYSEEQIQRIIDHYYLRVEGFMGNPRKKVEEEIRKWSDYEIHQGCLGDSMLEWARIPSEKLLDSAKIRCMLQIVQEVHSEGKKALIFSQYTTYLDVIQEVLVTYCPDIYYLRLDGSTVVSERQSLVNEFYTNSSVTLFLLSTKAGGQGLNLTAATTVLLMDQDWNPHNDRQAEDRVHRLGQTEDVTIYRLCCRGTVEESILRCCQKKLDLDGAFGGNTELLQAAILKDSLEVHEADNGEEKPFISLDDRLLENNVASTETQNNKADVEYDDRETKIETHFIDKQTPEKYLRE